MDQGCVCFLYHSTLSIQWAQSFAPAVPLPGTLFPWYLPGPLPYFIYVPAQMLPCQRFPNQPLSHSLYQSHNALLYVSPYISSARWPYILATILHNRVLSSDDHLVHYIKLLITCICLPSPTPQTEISWHQGLLQCWLSAPKTASGIYIVDTHKYFLLKGQTVNTQEICKKLSELTKARARNYFLRGL